MAVADVYDALISRRVYKEGMPHEQAVTIISEGRGSHFDPDIVDAFVALQDEFRAIALRYTDSDQDLARSAERRDKSADAVAAIAGSRVLLVEDNEMNRELALELLNDAGLSVAVACHGQEALDLLAADPHFDGILMDCQMPVMDGYTATRAIRQRPELAGIPIIAMTANTMAGDREQALAAGMDDHIGKPLNVDAMFGTLARWIKPRGDTPHEPGRSGELPGIDQRAGLATCGGKADLYRRMLLKFHEGQHDFAAAFAAATREADPEAAQRAAHTLRGTAASIGAMGVAQAAGRLEAACKEAAAAEQLADLLAEVLAALAPVIRGLQALAPAPLAALPLAAPDPVRATELLQRLRTSLADSDTEADELVQQLHALFQGWPEAEVFQGVAVAVAAFDFDLALERLGRLQGETPGGQRGPE